MKKHIVEIEVRTTATFVIEVEAEKVADVFTLAYEKFNKEKFDPKSITTSVPAIKSINPANE